MNERMNKVPTPSRPLKKWPTKESIMTADLTYQISGKKTNDQSKLASAKKYTYQPSFIKVYLLCYYQEMLQQIKQIVIDTTETLFKCLFAKLIDPLSQ